MLIGFTALGMKVLYLVSSGNKTSPIGFSVEMCILFSGKDINLVFSPHFNCLLDTRAVCVGKISWRNKSCLKQYKGC